MGTIPFPLDIVIASGIVGLVGLGAAFAFLKTRGDYFVLGTFALQMIVFNVLNDCFSLTNGPVGIAGIPPARLLGFGLSAVWQYLILSVLIATVLFLVAARIDRGSVGRIMRTVREDEVLAESIGIDVRRVKTVVFVITAAIAAAVGGLFAHYISFIAPTNFTFQESVFILAIVIIGGAGNPKGALIGATLLVVVPELLRFADFSETTAANLRQIVYGLLLIGAMIWRPEGIVGEYNFR